VFRAPIRVAVPFDVFRVHVNKELTDSMDARELPPMVSIPLAKLMA
jgi:hypothetical protein